MEEVEGLEEGGPPGIRRGVGEAGHNLQLHPLGLQEEVDPQGARQRQFEQMG